MVFEWLPWMFLVLQLVVRFRGCPAPSFPVAIKVVGMGAKKRAPVMNCNDLQWRQVYTLQRVLVWAMTHLHAAVVEGLPADDLVHEVLLEGLPQRHVLVAGQRGCCRSLCMPCLLYTSPSPRD